MVAEPRKAYWRFDRDQSNRVSTERIGRGQPTADAESPVAGVAEPHTASDGDKVVRMALPHASQLRRAIDQGQSGDKVAYPDPAAAPLGTDDEAAGTPPGPERVATALAHEGGAPVAAPATADPDQGGRIGLLLTLVAAAALAIVVAIVLARAAAP